LRSAADIRRLVAAHDGLSLIELLVALLILAVGILSTYGVYNSSTHATSVSEAQQAEIHRAQREIERLQSLPYKRLVLTRAPLTSTNPNNPGHYVSAPPGSCPEVSKGTVPTFEWSQKVGEEHADHLIIKGCWYEYEKESKKREEAQLTFTQKEEEEGVTAVEPETSWKDGRLSGTVYDYITWITKDPNCNAGAGCPEVNDFKRITVEVTNNSPTGSSAPRAPVLVSAIVANPHEVPIGGNPNSGNPLDNPEVKCTNGLVVTKCDYGLGNQTANTWYLTNSAEEAGYQEPSSNSSCMHYTNALVPSVCGGTAEAQKCSLSSSTFTSCPQPDLLYPTAPPEGIKQEYDFSPNIFTELGIPASTGGRALRRDSNATSCAATLSNDARMGELWATQPLGAKLKLSGRGGMTLYTQTLRGLPAEVTLCVGVYIENPVLNEATCKPVLGPAGKPILDPLNLLNSSTCATSSGREDSVPLGIVGFTMTQWPTVPTALSFTFEYMSVAKEAAQGSSIAVRVWPTAGSGEGIAIQYDAPSVASSVQINSE
jgi:prepilin-type N-terminal cleavage/methylation domain-containing protein